MYKRQVKGLQVLDVSMNEIQLEHLHELIRLREFYADQCQLKELPHFDAKQLTVLSMRHNHLKNIDSIRQYPHLQEVYLDDNEIVDASAVGMLEKMEILHLAHNHLQRVPAVSYTHLIAK